MAAADAVAVLTDALGRLEATIALVGETHDRTEPGSSVGTAELRERTQRLEAETHRVLLLVAELSP
jgi:hypothetical protein